MIIDMIALTNKFGANAVITQLVKITTSIHHQNSDRRLRPLNSKMRLEASFTASIKPRLGNSFILSLDNNGGPTVLVFNLAILDATEGIKQLLGDRTWLVAE